MLRKIVVIVALFLLVPSLCLATYTVVMKDGTKYRAKEKWVVVNGKALITLETGSTLSVDPKLIDAVESERMNSGTMGDARVIATQKEVVPDKPDTSTLGSQIHLRQPAGKPETKPGKTASSTVQPTQLPPATGETNLSNDVLGRFQQAYENVGLFDANVKGNGQNRIRIEVTADNEDQVFKAISATSFMVTKIPEATHERVEMVELFLKTINGGSGGKFQMNEADAAAIASKQMTWQDYFVKRCIF